jgi:ribosomal-protein-alanine N-acetyltransferase
MTMIRNAREDEAATLAGIGLRAWELAISVWGDPEDMRASAENAFLTFASTHWLAIDVAEKAGQAIGWAAREKLDNTITDLWVDPVFHRLGTGSMLLATLEDEIRGLGYDEAIIETHGDNAIALTFLGKRGYAIRSFTTTWSAKLDRDVEIVVMVKTFESDSPGHYGPS